MNIDITKLASTYGSIAVLVVAIGSGYTAYNKIFELEATVLKLNSDTQIATNAIMAADIKQLKLDRDKAAVERDDNMNSIIVINSKPAPTYTPYDDSSVQLQLQQFQTSIAHLKREEGSIKNRLDLGEREREDLFNDGDDLREELEDLSQ